jgi:hypothetical protein
LSGSPVLQVRGLIAEARAYISMQEFNQGERPARRRRAHPGKIALARAQRRHRPGLLLAQLRARQTGLAADYAARGLHALGLRPRLPIRVRLLRNQANALTRLGRIGEARQAIGKALELLGPLRDPKLSAELYLEDARVAQGDRRQRGAGRQRRTRAGRRARTHEQPAGRPRPRDAWPGRARARRSAPTARRELRAGARLFRALKLDREERRVLRVLAHEQLQDGRAPDTGLRPAPARLEESLDESDYQLAGEDLEARMKYEAAEVRRAAAGGGGRALNAQRERALAYQQRFAIAVAAASLLLFAIMPVSCSRRRRWSARLQQAIDKHARERAARVAQRRCACARSPTTCQR